MPLRMVFLLCSAEENFPPQESEPWSPVPSRCAGSAASLWSSSLCHRECCLQRLLEMHWTKMTAKWFKSRRTEATTLSLAFSYLF